jgi:pimeloyl-ACP methyl ester carboxylesterase
MESFAHYCARIAHSIEPGGRSFVGGVSFGAMVAMEVAHHLDVEGVFLIGGCRSHEEIASLFHFACATASKLPLSAFPFATAVAPLALRLFEKLNKEQAHLYVTMMREASPNQVRWAAGEIVRWVSPGEPGAPVYQIHGRYDEIVPVTRQNPDRVIEGRHLISLTRPEQVNRYLIEKMELITGSSPEPSSIRSL